MNTLTTTTCSTACWTAQEDVCRCMCGGKAHGIMRPGTDGVAQPERTARIKGHMYRLIAVGTWNECAAAYKERQAHIREQEGRIVSIYSRPPDFVIRRANESQVNGWPELTQAKNWDGEPGTAGRTKQDHTLWERIGS